MDPNLEAIPTLDYFISSSIGRILPNPLHAKLDAGFGCLFGVPSALDEVAFSSVPFTWVQDCGWDSDPFVPLLQDPRIFDITIRSDYTAEQWGNSTKDAYSSLANFILDKITDLLCVSVIFS